MRHNQSKKERGRKRLRVTLRGLSGRKVVRCVLGKRKIRKQNQLHPAGGPGWQEKYR